MKTTKQTASKAALATQAKNIETEAASVAMVKRGLHTLEAGEKQAAQGTGQLIYGLVMYHEQVKALPGCKLYIPDFIKLDGSSDKTESMNAYACLLRHAFGVDVDSKDTKDQQQRIKRALKKKRVLEIVTFLLGNGGSAVCELAKDGSLRVQGSVAVPDKAEYDGLPVPVLANGIATMDSLAKLAGAWIASTATDSKAKAKGAKLAERGRYAAKPAAASVKHTSVAETIDRASVSQLINGIKRAFFDETGKPSKEGSSAAEREQFKALAVRFLKAFGDAEAVSKPASAKVAA